MEGFCGGVKRFSPSETAALLSAFLWLNGSGNCVKVRELSRSLKKSRNFLDFIDRVTMNHYQPARKLEETRNFL